MNTTLRNTLGIVAGYVAGSAVNMGIIVAGGSVVAPPPGVDVSTMEGLRAAMPLFEPKHFLMPFLAHALGTLSGAAVAALIAVTYRRNCALAVGALFLAGGIAAVFLLPSPMWFNAVDLLCAYVPMAWLGWKLASRKG